MSVRIDPDDATPPYEQVRARLAEQVARGVLVAGTRLPTVRALAAELGLANATVARAYRELEAAGVVATRGRGGTVVTSSGDDATARVQAEAARYATLARGLGVSGDTALALVRVALRQA